MGNRNKTILILLVFILIAGTILGIKVYKGNTAREVTITNTSEVNKEENDIDNKLLTSLDSPSSQKEENIYSKLIINIINLIIIMVVVPQLLRKYNLLPCVIIMTIYRIILMLFQGGNLFVLGFLGMLIVIAFIIIYYYILLWFIEKVLLDVSPVAYFFGVLFFEIIASWGSTFLLALLIRTLIL